MKQFIKCPKCGAIELATIDTTTLPWWAYVHFCEKCGYVIMESEWDTVPALSIRQPWAWLICAGIKDIENRTWKLPEKHKERRILIHASNYKKLMNVPPHTFMSDEQIRETLGVQFPSREYHLYSTIIGSVEIVDCVQNHASIWAEHTVTKVKKKNGIEYNEEVPVYNWILANPIPLKTPVVGIKGKLSFFTPEIF